MYQQMNKHNNNWCRTLKREKSEKRNLILSEYKHNYLDGLRNKATNFITAVLDIDWLVCDAVDG